MRVLAKYGINVFTWGWMLLWSIIIAKNVITNLITRPSHWLIITSASASAVVLVVAWMKWEKYLSTMPARVLCRRSFGLLALSYLIAALGKQPLWTIALSVIYVLIIALLFTENVYMGDWVEKKEAELGLPKAG